MGTPCCFAKLPVGHQLINVTSTLKDTGLHKLKTRVCSAVRTLYFAIHNIHQHMNSKVKGKSKSKGHPRTCHKGPEGEWSYTSTLSLTSALDGCGWSKPRPGRFTPAKAPIPIVEQAWWTPRLVWMVAENFVPHRKSIPGPSSESQYRLSYPGPY
jgi:hypothetical protein